MQPEANTLFSPVQLAAFIGIAAFLISIWRNIVSIRRDSKARPDNAQLSESVVRLTAIVENHQQSLEKLERECAACRLFQSGEVGKAFGKFDEVAAMVNRLSGKIDVLLQQKGALRHG